MGTVVADPSTLSLSERLFKKIAEEITNGHLKPGDRLASERDLAKEFSMSRAVVREAVAKLRNDGLVVVRKGLGLYVSDSSINRTFRIDEGAKLTPGQLQSVFELLVTVEVAATRYAALRRNEDDLREMHRCMLGMKYAVASGISTAERDFEFHRAVYRASGNPYFERLSEQMENTVRRSIRQISANTAVNHRGAIPVILREHENILASRVRHFDPKNSAFRPSAEG